MGSLQAIEMNNMVDLETALHWHFTSNCYPPIPTALIPAAIEAINNARIEDYQRVVSLPDGFITRSEPTTQAIIEALRLEDFVV